MADRKRGAATTAEVVRSEWVTPGLLRLVLGGEELAGITAGEFTDGYVKLLFPRPGVTYPDPLDMGIVRRDLPREQWPVIRTYTIRRWIPELPELWLDFVVHGDIGVAAPWAASARPGDRISFAGPGGGYAPDPTADWHLLVGDESALPAIAASLAVLPADAVVKAFVEVSDAAEEQLVDLPVKAELRWFHRGDRPIGESLVTAVRELEFLPGRVHAFVHGEASFVRDLRRYLRGERELPADQLSISGYWRTGMNEDNWQSTKREWNQRIADEETGA